MAFLTDNHKQPEKISGEGKGGAVAEQPQSDSILRASRRKFIAGGMAAAPVILTLSNRSAFGAACTLSAAISGNLSRNPVPERCGFTPGYWQQAIKNGKWPEYRVDGVTPFGYDPYQRFSSIFGFNPNDLLLPGEPGVNPYTIGLRVDYGGDIDTSPPPYADPTLYDALPPYGQESEYLIYPDSNNSFVGIAVAAMLNAAFWGLVYGPLEAEVKSIFRYGGGDSGAGEGAGISKSTNVILSGYFDGLNNQGDPFA